MTEQPVSALAWSRCEISGNVRNVSQKPHFGLDCRNRCHRLGTRGHHRVAALAGPTKHEGKEQHFDARSCASDISIGSNDRYE